MPTMVDPTRRKSVMLATRLTLFEKDLFQQVLEYHGVGPSDAVRLLVRKEAYRIRALGRRKPSRKTVAARKPRRKA